MSEGMLGDSTVRRKGSMSDRQDRQCWVCFLLESEDRSADWVKPCLCRGTTKWVHQLCVQRWIDEKQKGDSDMKVSCPQCNVDYNISYPDAGTLVRFLDWIDKTLQRVCPFAAGGVVIGSIYWDAVTYGAVTIMQLLGHKEGLQLIEHADPSFLFFGLPTIPVLLILGQMVHWEIYVLKGFRKLQQFLTTYVDLQRSPRVPADPGLLTDPISASRILFWAMIQPTVANLCGNFLFRRFNSTLQRTIMGGVVFILIKGLITIFYKYQHFIRQAHRQIHIHPENTAAVTGVRSCWVCFKREDQNPKLPFLCPCKCQGTTKWVHESCIQAWIDEKQRGNSLAKIMCTQCTTDYSMTVPQLGRVTDFLDLMQTWLNRICPFAALGMMLGFLYWNAVTFGAITIMQILGHKEGQNLMETVDPLFLLLGLPTIPLVLTIFKLIPWEVYARKFWQKYSPNLRTYYLKIMTVLRRMLGIQRLPLYRIPVRNPTNQESLLQPRSASRILCGVLVFPTIATVFGKLFLSGVGSNVRRTILGGLMFSMISSGLDVYLNEKQLDRQAYRLIKDHPGQGSTPVTPTIYKCETMIN